MKDQLGPNARTAALVVLSVLGLGTATYLTFENNGLSDDLDHNRLRQEKLLAEKLHLEKNIGMLRDRLDKEEQALIASDGQVADLQRRVNEVTERAKDRDQVARRNKDLSGQIAALKQEKDRLEKELNGSLASTQDLQLQLDKLRQEQLAQAQRHDDELAGAQMVNNAEVAAIRGKKDKLTVVARRTREIRMAFDLPQTLAQGASFKVITPDGRSYDGADPAISMTLETEEAEPMASVSLMPELLPGNRASRVNLKFSPDKKLVPGTYRVDVLSNGEYLNTVRLKLR